MKLIHLVTTIVVLSIGNIFYSCEEVDTTPPTVTITSPQDGSTVSEVVTITCMSSDDVGVKKVELWINGISTGTEDVTEPYSLEWNTSLIEDGDYTIIVRSYDDSDNTTDSNPVSVNVHNSDTTPPTISITNPQGGSTVSDTVQILCNSSDNIGVEKVELWVDGNMTEIYDSESPYSLSWNTTIFENGTSHIVIVRSYDTSGNTTDSSPISLIVDNSDPSDTTPPTVSITSPQSGGTVNDTTIITCNSTDDIGVEKVELVIDGVSSGIFDFDVPYSLEWNTTLYEDGTSHIIIVRSYDTSGNTTDSSPISLIVDNSDPSDTTPPTVSITFSSSTSVHEEVDITCISSDDIGVEYVELWVDGITTGLTDTDEPYLFIWNTVSFEDGTSHIMTVRSYDTSGNTTDSDPISLTVDNSTSHPTVVEIYPITYQDGEFLVSWSQNIDDDFYSYTLYRSNSIDMTDSDLIFTSTSISDTNFIVEGVNENESQYFQIVVEDIFTLSSSSSISSGSSFKKIVFVSYRDGISDIFLMNGDGSGQTNLTNSGLEDRDPIFFPQGERILFSRDYNYFTMNLDGSEIVQLTNDNTEIHRRSHVITPDGSKIVYILGDDMGMYSHIYIMDMDGSNPTNLSGNSSNNMSPDISPDGSIIVYSSDSNITTTDLIGNNKTVLSVGTYPKFSPDGQLILYEYDGNLFTMNIDGSNQIQLTSDGSNIEPLFSPNGDKIIFRGHILGYYELYSMNPDGSDVTNLTNSPFQDLGPDFSPDGEKIVFVSKRDGNFDEIYLMNSNGSDPINLTNQNSDDMNPRFQP
jgi:Tol biopolymer transport system component